MDAPEPKLHHLTSQNYLRYFTQTEEQKLFRYDKKTGVTKLLPIVSIGGEKDYYTNFFNGKKDTSIESPFLSQIDGDYTSLIKNFESRQSIEIFRNDLILFVSTQYARVRPQKNRWYRALDDLNSQRAKLGVPEACRWPANNNNLNLAMLTEAHVHSRVLSNTTHFTTFISEDREFITCDNPADKSFLPLTRTLCLIMHSKKYPEEYTTIPNDAVETINYATFEKADRWVYSGSEESIKKVLKNLE